MGKEKEKDSGEKEETSLAVISSPSKNKTATVTGSVAKPDEHQENKEPTDPPKSLIVKVSTHSVLTILTISSQCSHNFQNLLTMSNQKQWEGENKILYM